MRAIKKIAAEQAEYAVYDGSSAKYVGDWTSLLAARMNGRQRRLTLGSGDYIGIKGKVNKTTSPRLSSRCNLNRPTVSGIYYAAPFRLRPPQED